MSKYVISNASIEIMNMFSYCNDIGYGNGGQSSDKLCLLLYM